jgi:oligopeptide transport system permease protein
MNQPQIDKSKLVLAHRADIRFDEEFKTKPIGYYKDAWIRFKKNKASVVAAIIMLMLIFFSLIGPIVRKDELYNNNVIVAQKLVSKGELPPKIEALKWIPTFSGRRNIVRASMELDLLPLTDPAIVEEYGRIIYTDLSKVKPNPDSTYSVRVDFYNYVNYELSIAYQALTADQVDAVLRIEEEKGITIFTDRTRIYLDGEGNAIQGAPHRAKMNYFQFVEEVYDVTPTYWFGADMRGRDWFNVLWNGARISLLIAFSVAIVNIMIGVTIGSISGYFGGAVDLIIERISEIIAGIPFLALITLLILRYGSGVGIVIIAFTLTGWLGISGVTRTQFYRYKNREYVLAARTLGATDVRIMMRHILPNAVGTLITSFVLYIPSVIFAESTYSYLGIINYGNVTSVGRMLADAQPKLREDPSLGFLILFPSMFVSFLMLSFNLFGNGLRDAFNPSLRGVE